MSDLLYCGHPPTETSGIGTGYGKDDQGRTFCYECCAERDREQMRQEGRITLYLTIDNDATDHNGTRLSSAREDRAFGNGRHYPGSHKVTNWPGTLSIPATGLKVGRHNIAGRRYDFWFRFEGSDWHGVQYGDNTQIAHCRRIKS